jgi:hypothetical protein
MTRVQFDAIVNAGKHDIRMAGLHETELGHNPSRFLVYVRLSGDADTPMIIKAKGWE